MPNELAKHYSLLATCHHKVANHEAAMLAMKLSLIWVIRVKGMTTEKSVQRFVGFQLQWLRCANPSEDALIEVLADLIRYADTCSNDRGKGQRQLLDQLLLAYRQHSNTTTYQLYLLDQLLLLQSTQEHLIWKAR